MKDLNISHTWSNIFDFGIHRIVWVGSPATSCKRMQFFAIISKLFVSGGVVKLILGINQRFKRLRRPLLTKYKPKMWAFFFDYVRTSASRKTSQNWLTFAVVFGEVTWNLSPAVAGGYHYPNLTSIAVRRNFFWPSNPLSRDVIFAKSRRATTSAPFSD